MAGQDWLARKIAAQRAVGVKPAERPSIFEVERQRRAGIEAEEAKPTIIAKAEGEPTEIEELIQKQIAKIEVEEAERTKEWEAQHIKLGTEEWVSLEDFNALGKEDQDRLKTQGIDKFNEYYTKLRKEFEDKNIQLDTGDWVNKKEYIELSPSEQTELKQLGVEQFNKTRQEKYQEEYKAKVAAVTPKAIPLKEGTGSWKGTKGSDFVRTARGDIPTWMLVPDFSTSYTPSGAPAMGTSYGMVLSGVQYPAFNNRRWELVRYERDMPLIFFGPQPEGGPYYEYRKGDIIYNPNGSPKIKYYNEPWTEETYLAHLGIAPERAKDNLFGEYHGVAHIYNILFSGSTYIDPETGEVKDTKRLVNPYGLLDKDGKLIRPMSSRAPEYTGVRWPVGVSTAAPISVAGVTGVVTRWPEAVATAMPELKLPGQWPSVVSSVQPLLEKLSQEKLKKQISLGEIIKTKDNELLTKAQFMSLAPETQYKLRTEGTKGIFEKTAKGELIDTAFVKSMPEDYRKVLMEQGFDIYASKVKVENEEIAGGQFMPKEEFNKLSPSNQKILKEEGYDAYTSELERTYEQLADGQWMPKEDFNKLPSKEQKILKEEGYTVYITKLRETNIQLPDGNWMPKKSDEEKGIVGLEDLPKAQQDILKEKGIEAWESKTKEWSNTLSAFVIRDDKGNILGHDLVSASRLAEGGYDKVSALGIHVKEKGISLPEGWYMPKWLQGINPHDVKEAISSLYKPEDVKELTASNIIVPKDTWEKMQIFAEDIASEKSVKLAAQKGVSLFNILNLQSGVTPKDTVASTYQLNDDFAKLRPQVVSKISEAVINLAKFKEDFVAEHVETKHGFAKSPGMAASAILDLAIVIPATIASGMLVGIDKHHQAQTAKTEEERDKLTLEGNISMLALPVGMLSWFAGRPYAIKQDPWGQTPYTAVLILGPHRLLGMAKAAKVKIDPRMHTNTAIALEADVGRLTIPKKEIGLYDPRTGKYDYTVYMSPARARELIGAVQKRIIQQIPDGVLKVLETGHDVVIRMPDGTAVGHLSAFQQSVPGVLWHAHPDAHTAYIKAINTTGHITIGTEGQYGGLFASGKAPGMFLARRASTDPGYLAPIISPRDMRDLPSNVDKLLDAGKLEEAKDLFYNKLGKTGQLGDYAFSLAKHYGKIPRLEDEMWFSPTFKLYKLPKVPWYMREKDVNTGVTYTTSPISAKVGGIEIKAGQKIPILWTISKRAIEDGRKAPTLGQFYKAELLDLVTTARKMMPWNIKLRKWTIDEEVMATDTMLASKFTGIVLKNKAKEVPTWEWEIHRKPEGGYGRPQEAMVFDSAGRRLRSRITGIVTDPKGRVMLVWDKVDKAWNLPGGRHDPYGGLGRDPTTGYISTKEQALYGQVLHETGIPISNVNRVGTYRGKVTTHSLYKQDVFVAQAKNTRFDFKKYAEGKTTELKDAIWWDGKSKLPRGNVYPAVIDVLQSAKWVDTNKLNIYKGTPDILLKARDKGFSNRYSVNFKQPTIHKPTSAQIKATPKGKAVVREITRADEIKIDNIIKEVAQKATERLEKAEKLPTISETVREAIADTQKAKVVATEFMKSDAIAKPEVKGWVKDFVAMSETEFNSLASKGKTRPFETMKIEIEAVTKGEKPLVTFKTSQLDLYNIAKKSDLEVAKIDGAAGAKEYVAYRKGNENYLQQYKDIVSKYSDIKLTDLRNNSVFHIEVGQALGYTKADIASFLKDRLGFDKVKEALIGSTTKQFKLDTFKDKLEISVEGKATLIREMTADGAETLGFKLKVKEGQEAFINNERVTGTVEVKYGDYIRVGDTGISFIPKEGSPAYFAEIIRKFDTDMKRNPDKVFTEEAKKVGEELVKNYERYKELPYRIRLDKIRLPVLGELRRDYEQKRAEATKKYIDDRKKLAEAERAYLETRPETRVEPRISARAEVRAEAKAEARVEPKAEARIEPRVEPRVEARIEPRIEPRVEPRVYPEIMPRAYTKPYPYGKPYPYVKPIPVPKPVPKPTPRIFPRVLRGGAVSSFEELSKEQKLASIAWRQGKWYHLIYPPYNKQNVLHGTDPFPGITVATGIGSAKKSLARVKGELLPDKVLWDLGIVDIEFKRDRKGKGVTMKYIPDPHDRSKVRMPIGMPETKVTSRRSGRTTTSTVSIVR